MKTIKREVLIAETLIREHIRYRISKKMQDNFLAEQKLRKVVRNLLEAETGTEEPSQYTGINVLADILEKIIPIIEKDYKLLTTAVEQRESFRNHIVHAIKNSLRPIESASEVASLPENFEFKIDRTFLAEKLKIDLDASDDIADPETVEGEFIDIEGDPEEEEFVEIEDQNETGRNFAAMSFKKIEKHIVDAFDMLADEEDQKMYYDYLVTNMLLYFDKFEDELASTLPDTSTPEYEAEKAEAETEGEGEADELAAEEPATAEEPAVEEPAAGEAEAGEEAAAADAGGPPLD